MQEREQALERTAREMTERAAGLETRVRQLEMENRWLKGLITEKSGEELLVDAPAMRDDYLARFAEAQAALRAELEGAGVTLVEHVLDHPLDAPLRALFA